MKFDFVIGNPPYQEEQAGDNKTFAPPVYHKFIEASYQIAEIVELIHPARFLFNAGNTPKQWNQAILSDDHFKVLHYEQDASRIFPNTEIKGGVVITYHDIRRVFGSIKTFTPYPELNEILKKVSNSEHFVSLSVIAISRTAYRLTDNMHRDHPEAIAQLSEGHAYDMATNILDRLSQVFYDSKPSDQFDYIQIFGRKDNERVYKYIRRDYVNKVVNLDKYKVVLPKANGSGELGEVLTQPILCEPGIGLTETFISIGSFDSREEATALLQYIKTKFTRALLGVLKVTQDITPEKWAYVPLQDFTSNSDIDWTQSVKEIDQQLYKKYGLSEEEITFIETHVKEMA